MPVSDVMAPVTVDGRADRLLTSGEAAAMLGVCRESVARWAKAEKIPSFRTPGGHHRYWESDVRALIEAGES